MELKGKRVVVTGGARGLGRALVDILVVRGAAVAVFDRDVQRLDALHSEHPDVACFPCDVSDPEQVAAALAEYHARNGAVEVLVNNAGILYSCPLVGIGADGIRRHEWADWRRVLAVNLDSVFLMTLAVVEKMITTRTKGVIVNISSVSAAGNAGQSAYSAAKAGVDALTATWAKELGAMGIRVAGVSPGFTETESTGEAMSAGALQEIVRRVPLRRLGKPEEIAKAVLAVIENDFIHGKVLQVDGGLVL